MKSRTDDRSYHEARALAELMLADTCVNPSIALVHRELAALHRRKLIEIVHLGEPQRNPSPLIGHRQLQRDMH